MEVVRNTEPACCWVEGSAQWRGDFSVEVKMATLYS